jgi:tape measure domain-containing protein
MEGGDRHMSSSIDERIVKMKFDNAAFEQGIARTRDSLGRFTKQLEMKDATKGLSEVDAAAKRMSLKNLESAAQAVGDKFKAMSVVGITALASLTQRAMSAGLQMAKSLTFSPVMDGFHEYETNLNSVQTILANTQAAGTNLKDVNAALNELNHYSDQTIYNFSEMAKNIGTFTAAGVGLKESTAAIKGIANLAALSGSNSEQASGAMYQLSQAISAGRVSLEDWNSVVNAGMGGTVFQRALAQTAVKMGTLKDGAVKLKGEMKNVTIGGKSFRESITAKPGQESWLTSKVLTQTLAQFTGDLTDAQLKAQGFSKSQIKAIQDQAKMAKAAATEVKTLTQLFGTLKESIGSGWSQTFQTIFGDFSEAKGLFTGVSNSLGKIVSDSSNARNKMLSDWKKLGGRDALISGLGNAFKALGSVIKPIHDAFRQIFPATTGKQLADMTKNFRDFTEKLKIGSETADKLKRTFAGVFAVFGIVIDVVKAVVGAIFDFAGAATEGSGGILNFTAKIGDFLVALRNSLKEGNAFTRIFAAIGKILLIPITAFKTLAKIVSNFFSQMGLGSVNAEKSVTGFAAKLSPMGKLLDAISQGGDKVIAFIKKFGDVDFGSVATKIADFFRGIGDYISEGLSGIDSGKVFAGINTGLFAALVLFIKNFVSSFGNAGGLGDIAESITGVFDELTGTLSAMQSTLKATVLLEIAAALGILTISVVALSKINVENLSRALGALTVMFTQLFGAMFLFNKVLGGAGMGQMIKLGAAMIVIALAVDLLVIAVKQLADLDWNGLAKGLTGVVVLLGAMAGAAKLMPSGTGLISTGLGMIALAAAIKILASAVTDLSGLSWQDMAKGLVGVGALLGSLVLFTKFAAVEKMGVTQGASLILLAAGIKILASAMQDFAKLSWEEIAKGVVSMAGSLAIISGALKLIPADAIGGGAGVVLVAASMLLIGKSLEQLGLLGWEEIAKGLTAMLGALGIISAALFIIPPDAVAGAAGILLVSLSLGLIATALQTMATMGWEEIGKAVTVLVTSLAAISAAMILMTGTLPGAAALLVVTAALNLLAPVLLTFGQMSWEAIAKGLLTLVGVFAVLGVAGLLLAPVVPVLLALGAAITLLGVGVLAVGAGVLLFATALTALSVAGAAGAAALVAIVTAMVGLLPMVAKQIGLAVISFAQTISKAGPAITKAITTVLLALIKAIGTLTPKIVTTLLRLLTMMLQQLANYVPKMVVAGLKLITGILTGIANNLPKVIAAAAKVIVAFLDGIGKALPKIIDSGVKLIISFINGVTKAINSHSAELGKAGGRLAVAMIKGMAKGIAAGVGEVVSAAKHLAGSAISAAKSALHINSPSKDFIKIGNSVNEGFLKGLKSGDKDKVDKAFKDLRDQVKTAMTESAKDIETLQAKLKRLTHARHKDNDEIKKTKAALAQAKKEHAAEAAAYELVNKKLKAKHAILDALAQRYDKVTDALKAAQDKLADIIKTRDDFKKQIIDQYDNLPDITPETHVAEYEADLKTQIEKTKQFANTLQRLRDLGLNDEAYRQLLSKGTDALPFANELLAGGKDAVKEINNLDSQLATAAKSLGSQASSELYDAAVHAAEGLVKGLQKQQKAIQKEMDAIAVSMVKAIKKALGIKSPSRVFMEIGKFSAKGLAQGLKDSTGIIETSASSMGIAATDSLKKSLSNMADMVTSNIDAKPVVTPVLDLSSVKKTAGDVGRLLAGNTISVDSAYSKAKAISEARMSNVSAENPGGEIPTKSVTFNQYNNSPKALSPAEIYRQTNNQLSKAKGALADL